MTRKDSPGALLHDFIGLVHEVADDHALAVMQESGLTLPQIIALHVVHRGPSLAIGDLAATLRLSMSATSSLIQRLVELELVTRTEDRLDRRQKHLALTRAGQALSDRLAAGNTQQLNRGLAHLPPTARDELVAALTTATEHLRARRDAARRGRSE